MTQAKTGRNEPCPCGSGKKYKHCCEGKAEEQSTALTTGIAVVVGLLVLLLAVGTIASLFRNDSDEDSAGRVWSEEHGHWHDAP